MENYENLAAEQKLYVMKNTVGLYKIGVSVSPEKRAYNIRFNSGFHTEVIKEYKHDSIPSIAIERFLHEELKAFRKEGEWFKLLKRDLKRIDGLIKSFEKDYLEKASIIPIVNIPYFAPTNLDLPCMKSEKVVSRVGYQALNKFEEFNGKSLKDLAKIFPESCIVKEKGLAGDISIIRIKDLKRDLTFNDYVFLNENGDLIKEREEKPPFGVVANTLTMYWCPDIKSARRERERAEDSIMKFKEAMNLYNK